MVSLAICLSLSATVILLCLFAPKLYIVLFNPSKNIHVKFKTTLSTSQAVVEGPSTSNNIDDISAANRRRRHTSTDYTTEVSLYTSKSDSSAYNINDEAIQTNTGTGVLFNGTYTDSDKHQHSSSHDDESTEFLSISKPRSTSNYNQNPQLKPAASSLVIAGENPWKRLSNVRYKLDGNHSNQQNQTSYHHVHAQHITFV